MDLNLKDLTLRMMMICLKVYNFSDQSRLKGIKTKIKLMSSKKLITKYKRKHLLLKESTMKEK